MGEFSIWHWLVVLLVVLLLFGGGKMSSLMGDFAKGIKAFRKHMAEDAPEPVEAPAASIAACRSSAAAARRAGSTPSHSSSAGMRSVGSPVARASSSASELGAWPLSSSMPRDDCITIDMINTKPPAGVSIPS